MKHYYTYAWLRKDGTPYYIGKGKGNRAYDRKRQFCPPSDRVLILKKDLFENDKRFNLKNIFTKKEKVLPNLATISGKS